MLFARLGNIAVVNPNDMQVRIADVGNDDMPVIRELVESLGIAPEGVHAIFPKKPRSGYGTTRFVPPRVFAVTVRVLGRNPADKLAELIHERIGKDCTVEAL